MGRTRGASPPHWSLCPLPGDRIGRRDGGGEGERLRDPERIGGPQLHEALLEKVRVAVQETARDPRYRRAKRGQQARAEERRGRRAQEGRGCRTEEGRGRRAEERRGRRCRVGVERGV